MNDLYYPSKRELYYKQAHRIKKLMRELQTTDEITDVFILHRELQLAVAKLVNIKCDDLTAYKSHMTKMLNDICKWGKTDGEET